MNSDIHCYGCNNKLNLEGGQKIYRSEECPQCYSKIHVCKMCRLYDASAYNECREEQAERVLDKERINYCDYFILYGGPNDEEDTAQAMNAANALFKD